MEQIVVKGMPKTAVGSLKGETKEQVVNDILELLRESDNPVSRAEITEILNCTSTSTDRALKFLLERNEINKIGAGRQTKYGLNNIVSMSKASPYVTDFKGIESPSELIHYLSNINDRLNHTSVLCQYTSLKAVIGIISDKSWYLGSPKNMNDGLELQHGLDTRNDIFFSSFMAEQKESIAMWSMYAQPWEDGIMISIPVKEFKQWIRDIKIVYRANPVTKKPDRGAFVYLNKAKISVTRVAYSNQNIHGETQSLTCGTAKNYLLKSIDDPSLIGYIKDDAWSYEKEVRLRADLGIGIDYEGVAVDVPDYVIDAMVITKGPRFVGDLTERLQTEISRKMKTESSLFYDKLKYTPCDGCTYKKLQNFQPN